jgi:hypothetical protein
MNASVADTSEPIDGRTCRSICDAVGERLQRDLRPDPAGLSPYLKDLLQAFERQDMSQTAPANSIGGACAK